jgi:hypothetical protein
LETKRVVMNCDIFFRYLLKMDDDIMVDYFQLMAKLESRYQDLDDILLGYKQIGLRPQRDPKSKWFVSRQDYPSESYPDFLSGWAYVTTPKTALKIAKEANQSDLFWIDDIWVAGMLASQSGIKLESLNNLYTVYVEHIECCLDHDDEDKLMCDFIVGPSQDRFDLIQRFGDLAIKCHRMQNCSRRKWDSSVINTCAHIDNPFFLPDSKGVGEVFVISNKVL